MVFVGRGVRFVDREKEVSRVNGQVDRLRRKQ
jgi:hypothetical protein